MKSKVKGNQLKELKNFSSFYFNGGGVSNFYRWVVFLKDNIVKVSNVILILLYFLCVSNRLDFNAGVCGVVAITNYMN